MDPTFGVAKLRGNYGKIQWINFFWMFLVVIPVVVPIWQSHGLDMHQVYLLQTVFALAVVILEVPSGYVADHIGRKTSLVLGGALAGCAFTWFAFADEFWKFVVFEIMAAVGASLYSGSDVALIYDTDEAIRRSASSLSAATGDIPAAAESSRAEPLPIASTDRAAIASLGRRLFYAQSGETLASILGGLLVLVSLDLPARVNAVTAWGAFLIALTLVEPPRERASAHRSHFEQVKEIAQLLFVRSALLRLVLLNLIVYGLATLTAVWAFQGYWKAGDISLAFFGWLWAGYNLTVALVGRVAHAIEDRIGSAAVVVSIGLLPVLGFFGMAASGAWLGTLFGLAFQVARGLTQVVLKDALNSRVPTDYRATANSISTLGVRFGFALVGPAMGWMIDGRGYSYALGAFGALYVVLFVIVCVPLLRMRSVFRNASC
ncbi:MAG: MFS transporter [Candidatus Eisenbacteria bacterium]